MNDDTTLTGFDGLEGIDDTLTRTYTQIVSCVVGRNEVERRRQSLRAKLDEAPSPKDWMVPGTAEITDVRACIDATSSAPAAGRPMASATLTISA